MRKTGTAFVAIAAAAASFLGGWRCGVLQRAPLQTAFQSTGPTITQLERLAQLVSMKVHVADVLTATDDDFRGSWLVKGDALVAVDLSRAKLTGVDELHRTATVELPQPTVFSARVDHSRTMKWDVRRVGWLPWRGDQDALRDRAMLEAQKLVEHAARSDEAIAEARLRAQEVIEGFYAMLGWRMSIQWESAAAPAD